jgi:hypothetical protein
MNKGTRQSAVFLAVLLLMSFISTFPSMIKDVSAGIDASVQIAPGIRHDDLDWNIADIDGSPDILSELTWTDLTIIQIKTSGKLIVSDKFYMRGSLDYGEIIHGENQDSDYSGDHRTGEYSRSNNSTDDGNVFDVSAGLGYQFRIKRFTIAPLIGYSYHEQDLKITDGYQTIPRTGHFPGLDSKYDAQWTGPWTGLDFSFDIIERLIISGTIEYHWADYKGVGDWNLRDDFEHPKSFEHTTDGKGVLASAAINYAFSRHWGISLTGNYMDWTTDSGTSRTFFADGTDVETGLNEVNWDSVAAELGITFRF